MSRTNFYATTALGLCLVVAPMSAGADSHDTEGGDLSVFAPLVQSCVARPSAEACQDVETLVQDCAAEMDYAACEVLFEDADAVFDDPEALQQAQMTLQRTSDALGGQATDEAEAPETDAAEGEAEEDLGESIEAGAERTLLRGDENLQSHSGPEVLEGEVPDEAMEDLEEAEPEATEAPDQSQAPDETPREDAAAVEAAEEEPAAAETQPAPQTDAAAEPADAAGADTRTEESLAAALAEAEAADAEAQPETLQLAQETPRDDRPVQDDSGEQVIDTPAAPADDAVEPADDGVEAAADAGEVEATAEEAMEAAPTEAEAPEEEVVEVAPAGAEAPEEEAAEAAPTDAGAPGEVVETAPTESESLEDEAAEAAPAEAEAPAEEAVEAVPTDAEAPEEVVAPTEVEAPEDEAAEVAPTDAEAPAEEVTETEPTPAEAPEEEVTDAEPAPVEEDAEARAEAAPEDEAELEAQREQLRAEAEEMAEDAPEYIVEDAPEEEFVAPVEEAPQLGAEQQRELERLLEDPEIAAAVTMLGGALADRPDDEAPEQRRDRVAAALAALQRERDVEAETEVDPAEAEAAEVIEDQITADEVRRSAEDFASRLSLDFEPQQLQLRRERGRDLERAGLAALAGLAVGMVIERNRVVARSDDRVVVDRGEGDLAIWRDDDVILRQEGANRRIERYEDGSSLTRWDRPDGSQVVTIRDATGRVLWRERILPDGTSVQLVNDMRDVEPIDVRELPPPRTRELRITQRTDPELALAMLSEAEADVRALDRGFTLRQVRDTYQVRQLVPLLSPEPITFETNRANVRPEEAPKLMQVGRLMERLLDENPREVFLVEGHTDATGPAAYNLALSDRRAESVALALTEFFEIPPENLVIQGYGERHLRIPTAAAEERNRRVAIRRITPLLERDI